jgi:hypothetical protein
MTDEALRAFRGITTLGFDVVRSSYGFFPHFLVEVTEEDVNKKIEALSKYETYRDRYYFNSELTRSIMVRHGALAESPFAEGFDILRIVGKFEAERVKVKLQSSTDGQQYRGHPRPGREHVAGSQTNLRRTWSIWR